MMVVEGNDVGFHSFRAFSIRSALDFTVAAFSVGWSAHRLTISARRVMMESGRPR
jgi:hypothetical protein